MLMLKKVILELMQFQGENFKTNLEINIGIVRVARDQRELFV